MAQKQNMAEALRESLKGEERAVQDRFKRAENIIDPPKKEPKKPRKKKKQLGSKAAMSTNKVVRDTFCMPKSDHALIEELQQRALAVGVRGSKSEVIRAGLKALNNCTKKNLKELFAGLEKVALGRPKR